MLSGMDMMAFIILKKANGPFRYRRKAEGFVSDPWIRIGTIHAPAMQASDRAFFVKWREWHLPRGMFQEIQALFNTCLQCVRHTAMAS